MRDHSDLIERARAYRPYNHLNDGDLVRQLLDALSSQSLSLSEAMEEKDGAYAERNQCVALIAKFALVHGCVVGIAKTAIEGWDEAWHGCVYIDLPTGQVSWHYHDSEAHLFDFLPPYEWEWDGHSTPEKYARVNAAFPMRPTVLEKSLAEERLWNSRANEELNAVAAAIGSTRFMNPPDGGDASLADQVRRMRAELEAKEARLAALENGPAGLADATNNPASSDLSSLRKGAEVVGEAAAYDFVAGWHERQAKLFREMAEDDPRTAEPQRKRAFEAAIHHAASAAALRNRAADDRRAALVSGSREDGE